MVNQYDVGAQQDFDTMTAELGTTIQVFPKKYEETYEGFEDENTKNYPGTTETAFLQELDTKHEMVSAGQLNVGDVRITFQSNTVANEEAQVLANGLYYKVINLTYVKGMNNAIILYVKAYGKKLPKR